MSVLRLVIDSNQLRSSTLREFLGTSKSYQAVLIDYVWMEAYKGNSLLSITQSLSILSEFPDQVVILKGTKEIGALDARAPGLAERMIWPGSDGEFRETVIVLRDASNGHAGALAQIERHGVAAKAQMKKLLDDASGILEALPGIQRIFGRDEINDFRLGKPYSLVFAEKVFLAARYMAMNYFDRHPLKPRKPSRNSLKNTFLFRFSLATVFYVLEWIRGGSQKAIRPDRVRNDVVDIMFATYSTFFNGLLSEDKRALALDGQLWAALKVIDARLSPSFWDTVGHDKLRH